MNNFNKRVYQMMVRVVVFATTYPQYFGKGTLPGQLLEQIQAAVRSWSGHATSQFTGKGAVRRSGGSRLNARSALWSQLEAISRTARSLNIPEYWLPRNRGDMSVLEVGKSFFGRILPLKQEFIDGQLPADFVEKLDIAIQNLESAINDHTTSKGVRKSATEGIEQTRSAAVATLLRLDPIMENLLGDDPPTLAVWQSCRRVERAAVSRTVTSEDPPPADPPITNDNAAAG